MSTIVCHNTLVEPSQAGWRCIESLSNALNLKELEVYVHPSDRRSKNILSEKSLEMCTENLGSETGSDTTDDDIFSIMSWDSECDESTTNTTTSTWKPRPKAESSCRKAGYESLPPPLTTTLRVQPHRESGRLVMMVVEAPPRWPSIHAERSNGRLTMSLTEEFSDEEEDDVDETVEESESPLHSTMEGMDAKNKEFGEKFGIGEIQRLRRCNEGGRGSRRFINWETYWVAT